MKGIVYTKFGTPDVLKLMEVKKPVPKDNQVLIKVKAASMYYLDYSRFTKQINGGKTPISTRFMDIAMGTLGKVIGSEVSGIVEAVGKNIKHLHIGDEVYGATSGLTGGLAEYALSDEFTVFRKPQNLTFEEASAVPVTGITAYGAIEQAEVKQNQKVLVYGASGGVGQYLVQLAKAKGAIVTAVCSTKNVKTAYAIGADYVIDYKKEDFTKSKEKYDVIFSANGYYPLKTFKRLLAQRGKYIAIGNSKQMSMAMLLGFIYSNSKQKFMAANYFSTIKQPTLPYMTELIEKGKLKPNIQQVYPVQDVKKVIIDLCKNHAQGKVVFTI